MSRFPPDLLVRWRKQEPDFFYFEIERTHIEKDRTFSKDAVDQTIEGIGAFVLARALHRWDRTGEPPTVARIRVDVELG